MFFTQIYIYDNNKNIYMLIYEKSFKNVYAFFIKLLGTSKQFIKRNSIYCFKNQVIFHRVSIEIGLNPSLLLFVFICSLRTPSPSTTNPGFSTGVVSNICGGVHLIEKLPAISLQACKFTKNELLQSYF